MTDTTVAPEFRALCYNGEGRLVTNYTSADAAQFVAAVSREVARGHHVVAQAWDGKEWQSQYEAHP